MCGFVRKYFRARPRALGCSLRDVSFKFVWATFMTALPPEPSLKARAEQCKCSDDRDAWLYHKGVPMVPKSLPWPIDVPINLGGGFHVSWSSV